MKQKSPTILWPVIHSIVGCYILLSKIHGKRSFGTVEEDKQMLALRLFVLAYIYRLEEEIEKERCVQGQ